MVCRPSCGRPGSGEMRTEWKLPAAFEAVRDGDEEILWVGTPNFTAFIVRGIPFLIVGLLWGAIDYFGFIRHMDESMAGFAIPFFILHLFPFWLSILNMIRLFLVHGNTYYAFTNKRLMMRSGFWGTDFKAVDYDTISDIEVNVNPIENMLGVGTVHAYTGRDGNNRIYDSFIGIREPYEVFKQIKEITVDVKTDWNYPNAIRPEENPGYRTRYRKQ